MARDSNLLEGAGLHLAAPPIISGFEAELELEIDRAMGFDEFSYALARYLLQPADLEEQIWGVESSNWTERRRFRRQPSP
ncbi:MAG TPA: hypothetical protein VKX96_08380 [Chloroflexota bacterium]|nr:hypothetical protein [Chloroflexota bacterium]